MVYVILISYIAITFWGSLFGLKGKNKTPDSYFLADRNLGTLSLFFTILATNFSAFYFLGFAGEGYKIGYSHYVMMALGTALAAVSFFIIGTKVWQLGKEKGYITPAELVYGETGSRPLSYLFSAVMIVFTLPYLALQIIGGGYILENLTGGEISYALSIILLTIFTIFYVIIGGMHSVAKTDLKQGLIVIIFMTIAVFIIGAELGGVVAANQKAAALLPDLFSLSGVNEHFTGKKWFSYMVFWFFCVPMFPQLFMRFYIARDLKFLKQSTVLYALIPLFISILPVMIGVWGHLSFPGLEGKASDQILPMMLMEHTTDWFAAIIMTGAIAAFMSTLDSQLLALSTMLTRDFYKPLSKKQMSFTSEVKLGRVFVALIAGIGLLIAFKPFDTIFDMGKMAFSGLAILFATALMITRFKVRRPATLIVSIIVPLVVLIAFHYQWIPTAWAFGFESFIIVIALSLVLAAMSTIKTSKAEAK